MSDSAKTQPLASDDAGESNPAGMRLGRYIVIGRLGEGGVGEVFRAYDPQLDRKVAVKRLHGTGTRAAALLREAKILARLNHPNIVSVYDVGIEAERAYLAMELVDGADLSQWLREHGARAPWRTILHMLIAAGEGLAAAHAQGIVHGDIKPANILVGNDPRGAHAIGRVRVGDFGVARLSRIAEAEGAAHDSGAWGRGAGTPRYMAPEQHDGAAPRIASDVYGFATTAWEALFGALPFAVDDAVVTAAGTTLGAEAHLRTPGQSGPALLAALVDAKKHGPPAAPARTRGVPARIVEALRRGLAPAPEDRFAAMAELLAVLGDDSARRRRTWLAIGAAGGLGIATASAFASLGEPEDPRCTGATAELAGVWDATRRAAVEAAAQAIGGPWSVDDNTRIADALDVYARDWTAMHASNCEATTVRGEQSAGDMELRSRCLHRARSELGATVDLLASADLEIAWRAHDMVARLPGIDRCADPGALERDSRVPDDPTVAAAVEELREELAPGTALQRAGKFRESLAILDPLAERADAIAFPPLVAEVAIARGFALERLGEDADAEAVLRRAVETAIEHGPQSVGSRAAAMLASQLSDFDARFGEADAWARVAVSLARKADPDSPLEAYALNRRGSLRMEQGRFDDAAPDYERALEIWQRTRKPDHLDIAMGLTSLGRLHAAQRDWDQAESYHARALEISMRAFAEGHPEIAVHLMNLGQVFEGRGDYAKGLEYHRRALAILEPALGPDHIEISGVLTNMGVCQNNLGMRDEAMATYRRSLAIVENARGEDDVEVGRVLINVGVIHLMEQRYPEAEQTFERSIAILERVLGEDHPHTSLAIANHAMAVASQGRKADAERAFLRVLAIRERTLPANHPSIANTLGNLAQVRYEQGRHREAIADFERALAIRDERGATPKDRAFETFGLARAVWAIGEKGRARTLARAALAAYVDAGPGYEDRHAEVAAWLSEHG